MNLAMQTVIMKSKAGSKGENMFFKSKRFQLCLAFALGVVVLLLPRPEGTRFKITGDDNRLLLQNIGQHFTLVPTETEQAKAYIVEATDPESPECTAQFLRDEAARLKTKDVRVDF